MDNLDDSLTRLTLSESEIKAQIARLKEQRDALPPFDVRRYELQDAIYRANEDLIWLQRSRRRK